MELLIVFTSVVVEGSFNILANLAAFVLHLELGEHACSLGDDTSDLDEGVQVNLSKVSELVLYRKLLNSYEDLVVDLSVVGVNFLYKTESHLIHCWEHECRLLCQPNGNSGVLLTKV